MRSVSKAVTLAFLCQLILPVLPVFESKSLAAEGGLDYELIYRYTAPVELPQLPSPGQFNDLRPTDWAYQALENIIKKYGCVGGYPDGGFRGGMPITRYEAAALLNSCLDRITEISSELKRLLLDLEKELALLRGKTDAIEAKLGEVEAMQFSTTTKLMGVTAMYMNTASGTNKAVSSAIQALEPGKIGRRDVEPEPLNSSVAVQYSTIIGLATSFTGKDLLSIDFYTSNFEPYSSPIFGSTPNVTGTYETRLSFDAPPYDNTLSIADLFYRFKIGESIMIKATAVGSEVSSELIGNSLPFLAAYPYTQSISRFGRFDPIYYQTLGRPGFSAEWQIGSGFNLGGGYFGEFTGVLGGGKSLTPDGKTSSSSQAAIAQISWFPSPQNYTFGTALTYVKASANAFTGYGFSGFTGSQYADQPFGTINPPKRSPKAKPSTLALTPVGINGDHLSLGFGWNALNNVYLTGDVGYARATALSSYDPYGVKAGDTADIFEWNIALALNNVLAPGNLLTFVVGNPFRVVGHSNAAFPTEDTSAWHLEVSYTYRVTDKLSLVPGVIYIINPENNVNNDPIGVWSLKTVFFF
jgi:hypothetical protein